MGFRQDDSRYYLNKVIQLNVNNGDYSAAKAKEWK